ncbi:MAG: TraB/GumN family protein [Bacteroidetes bacterium]|nr:TraB/GumN family protein [Bacteroidota bacterium]
MIVERNRTMAHSYDSIIKSGKSLFAGIGAAHLSGNEGVLQFLKDMGYKVRPMEFSNPKPGKTKTKMEEMEVPTTLSNQYLERRNIFAWCREILYFPYAWKYEFLPHF